jgi:hypothetical protein
VDLLADLRLQSLEDLGFRHGCHRLLW